ncbi:MAG: nuclear transport factor 2 family protein [Bacteroidetes bacterium]|jgi:hypothetical protein|nr:nuclear transport factor 2 family protein [Bacteroidota bacterium]
MSTIKEKVAQLNQMILGGQIMEAFEQFYHPEVRMQENDAPIVEGKDANREREKDFVSKIIEFRGAEVKEVAVGPESSMVVWHYDFTHADYGVRNYTQVCLQDWKDGRIISERFIYVN